MLKDQRLRQSQAYAEMTENALRSAKAVIVLWSPRFIVPRSVPAKAALEDWERRLALW